MGDSCGTLRIKSVEDPAAMIWSNGAWETVCRSRSCVAMCCTMSQFELVTARDMLFESALRQLCGVLPWQHAWQLWHVLSSEFLGGGGRCASSRETLRDRTRQPTY